MRKKKTERELFDMHYQMLKFSMNPKNPHAAELDAIDKLLDEIPEVVELVHADINTTENRSGRKAAMSAEQALRSAIVMQLKGWDYRTLYCEIDSGILYRKFTRFYEKKIPHFATLNDVIKMITPETMKKVNEALLRLGIKKRSKTEKRFVMIRWSQRPTLPGLLMLGF